MGKDLKILSINFPFKAPWVIHEPSLATQRALFDFDVVVIRPYLLLGVRAGGQYEMERSGPFFQAKHEMTDKIDDISRLLKQGGLLVVILDARQELTYHTGRHSYTSGGTIYTVTNYDFLEPQFSDCLRNGTGNNIEILRADPFSSVIKKSDVEWTSFIVARPPHPLNDPIYFARNGATSYVGGRVALDAGNIVFLPNFRRVDEEQFFEACREYRYEREGTPPPGWSTDVFLPGLSEADEKIIQLDEMLQEVEHFSATEN